MTTATATQPLVVGDYVSVKTTGSYRATNGYGNYNLNKNEVFVISREYKDSVSIRRAKPKSYSVNSFNVAKDKLKRAEKPTDPATVPAGKIGPEHPDLQWLWERAGKIATEAGHCSEYDKIAETLGIPGRERSFTVTVDHNGLKVSSKVKARSRVEAEKKVKETLSKPV